MALATSSTRGGISWFYTHSVSAGTYINGDIWTLAGVNGGVELSAITPAPVLGPSSVRNFITPFGQTPDSRWAIRYHDRNGSMLCPHAYHQRERLVGSPANSFYQNDGKDHAHGWHGSGVDGYTSVGYIRELNWAATQNASGTWTAISNTNRKILRPGESLVSCESGPNTIVDGTLWTAIRRHSILTCVTQAPDASAFRPGFSTSGIAAKESTFNASDINYNLLGNINASAVSSLMPSATYYNVLVSALSGPDLTFHRQGENPYFAADRNILGPGYGQGIGAAIDIAIGYINTNMLSMDNKVIIANYLIQRAIDLLESFVESIINPVSTLGLMDLAGGGGGHNNSRKFLLYFLYALLKDGAKRTYVASVLQVIEDYQNSTKPIFIEDNQLFTITSSFIGKGTYNNFGNSFLSVYPQFNSVSTALTYQASDVGKVDFRGNVGGPTSAPNGNELKMWSHLEASSIMSGVSSYDYNTHINAQFSPWWGRTVYNAYRHCCTTLLWGCALFGFKAMGADRVIYDYNDRLNKYTQYYFRKQRSGPNPDPFDSFNYPVPLGTANPNTGTIQYLSSGISTRGLMTLYEAFVKPSIGVSSIPFGRTYYLTSGVESVSLPTASSIYIDCSTPFIAGSSNTVRCYGLNGLNPSSSYMWLFVSDESQWAYRNNELLGAKYVINLPEFQFPFVIPTGSTTANITIPLPVSTRNARYIAQAFIVTPTLQVYTTNALRFTVF